MKLLNLGERPTPLISILSLTLAMLFACVARTNAQEWSSAARQEGLYASWSQQSIPPSVMAGQPISIDQTVSPSLLGGQIQAVNYITTPQGGQLGLETIQAPQGQPITSNTAPITSNPTPEAWLSGGTTSGLVTSDGTFGGLDYGVTMGGPMAMGGSVTACGSCGGIGCNACGPLLGGRPFVSMPLISGIVQTLYCGPLQNMTFHAGAQGFSNPKTFGAGGGGSGFHEGIQYAVGLDGPLQIGFQAGLSGVHSFNSTVGGIDYDQLFWTIGLFHRGLEGGLQWSIVYDGLNDKGWQGKYDLGQVRMEIGFSTPTLSDFGFYGAFNTSSVEFPAFMGKVETYDIYAVYYRRYWCEGGSARGYVGSTNHGNGTLGADFSVPLNDRWNVTGAFTCLFDNGKQQMWDDEAWNVNVGFEYSFGGLGRQKGVNPYRPTLDVADNGSMISRFIP